MNHAVSRVESWEQRTEKVVLGRRVVAVDGVSDEVSGLDQPRGVAVSEERDLSQVRQAFESRAPNPPPLNQRLNVSFVLRLIAHDDPDLCTQGWAATNQHLGKPQEKFLVRTLQAISAKIPCVCDDAEKCVAVGLRDSSQVGCKISEDRLSNRPRDTSPGAMTSSDVRGMQFDVGELRIKVAED